MKIVCENDHAQGRGYALFRCTEVLDSSAAYTFSLCRASDQTFLGRSGWQKAEEQHSPDSMDSLGDSVLLHVGPSIMDSLDENENYRITLHAPGLSPQRAAFSVANINRSLRAGAGAVHMAAPQPEPQPAPPPPPPPPPVEEPVQEAPLTIAEPPTPPRKSPLPLILAVVLLLALAGGGAWWFMQNKGGDKPLAEQTTAAPTTAKEETKPDEATSEEAKPEEAKPKPAAEEIPALETEQAAQPAPTPEAAPAPAPAPQPVMSPRDQVRQYLGGTPSAQGAADLARNLLSSPEGESESARDSVYRLYYYAHLQGNAEGTLGLARSADPAQPAWGSLPKNAAEAWGLYAQAAPNKPEAAQAMHSLKKWLEDETAKGNAQARVWIEEIARAQAPK